MVSLKKNFFQKNNETHQNQTKNKKGLIAVPVVPPNPQNPKKGIETILHIVKDCQAKVALTTKQFKLALNVRALVSSSLSQMIVPLVSTNGKHSKEPSKDFKPASVGEDDLVFIQYTSGSTSLPKGVMVSNRNLMHNLDRISHQYGIRPIQDVALSWAPHFHDMGLIGGRIFPIYLVFKIILMSPVAFVKNPFLWISLLSQHRVNYTCGPNFAYMSTKKT